MTAVKTTVPRSGHKQRPKRRLILAPANLRSGVDRLRKRMARTDGSFWSDDDLLALGSSDDRKHELWNGKIITMPPGGAQHGDVIARVLIAVGSHVYERRLGRVYDGQTGFRLSTDHCFEPDVSFVSKERLKLILPVEEKLFHGAPDLAVEVLSPSDSVTGTERKITLYLVHGARLGWMIDPKNKTVRVYREPGKFELLRSHHALSGNAVLPGFRFALQRLFENPALD